MSVKKKVVELDIMNDIGIRSSELRKVVAKLEKRSVAFKSDQEWMSAIESTIHSIRNNPLQEDIRKNTIAINQLCPVCQNPSEPITLLNGRKAFYCKAHNAVTPAIVQED